MKNNFWTYYSSHGAIIMGGYFPSGDKMAGGGKVDNDEFWNLLEYVSKYFSDFPKVKKYFTKLSKEIDRPNNRPIFGYTNGTFFSPIVDKASYWLYDNFDDIIIKERKRILLKTRGWHREYLAKEFKSFGKYLDEKFRPFFTVRYAINHPFSYPPRREFRNAQQIFKIVEKLFKESLLSKDYDISYSAPADYINIYIVKKEKMSGGGEINKGDFVKLKYRIEEEPEDKEFSFSVDAGEIGEVRYIIPSTKDEREENVAYMVRFPDKNGKKRFVSLVKLSFDKIEKSEMSAGGIIVNPKYDPYNKEETDEYLVMAKVPAGNPREFERKVKSSFDKNKTAIKKAMQSLIPYAAIDDIKLYGSIAEGRSKVGSDIDVKVYVSKIKSGHSDFDVMDDLYGKIGIPNIGVEGAVDIGVEEIEGKSDGGNIGLDVLDKKRKRLADPKYRNWYFKGILKKDMKQYLKKGDTVYFSFFVTPAIHGTRLNFSFFNEYTNSNIIGISRLYDYIENIQKAPQEEYEKVMEKFHSRDYDTYSIG